MFYGKFFGLFSPCSTFFATGGGGGLKNTALGFALFPFRERFWRDRRGEEEGKGGLGMGFSPLSPTQVILKPPRSLRNPPPPHPPKKFPSPSKKKKREMGIKEKDVVSGCRVFPREGGEGLNLSLLALSFFLQAGA